MLNDKKLFIFILTICTLIIIFQYIKSMNNDENTNKVDFGIGYSGVNVHFTGNPIDIKLIRDAGIKVVRTDLSWEKVEKKEGKFDFISTGYDQLTNALIKNNIIPFYILDYSNSLYEKNRAITTDVGLQAYDNYVSEVTTRYKGKHIIWEIWNEPNISIFWEPQPNYYEYAKIVKSASKIIRKNDPTGLIVAPALGGVNSDSLNWLKGLFKQDILDYIDAISVHPYRNENPETVIQDYNRIRNMINKFNKNLPIISGEWGYSTANNWRGLHMNTYQQADYLVRMLVVNLSQNVPISIWYDWKDDGVNPDNGEYNFGMRSNDVTKPKPAYFAMKTFNKLLSKGYKFKKRINTGNDNDYLLNFEDEKGNLINVYWTTDSSHIVRLPNNIYGEIVSMYGEKIGLVSKNIHNIKISNSPIYILNNAQ